MSRYWVFYCKLATGHQWTSSYLLPITILKVLVQGSQQDVVVSLLKSRTAGFPTASFSLSANVKRFCNLPEVACEQTREGVVQMQGVGISLQFTASYEHFSWLHGRARGREPTDRDCM